jgi:hypothetical protein
MIEPKPGESFEAYGLTWTVQRRSAECDVWVTRAGERSLSIARTGDGYSLWWADNTAFDTAELALAWSIRTCPGARCANCHWGDPPRRHECGFEPGELHCDLREHVEPESGWCHRWEARR